MKEACDFQTVLRAHRNFVAAIVRLSMIDNLIVQEGIERVLQITLRFIAVFKLINSSEDTFERRQSTESGTSSTMKTDQIIVPTEEIDDISREFFTQVSYLYQVMRKVENRGFIFRLDFNGYLSNLSHTMSHPTKSSSS